MKVGWLLPNDLKKDVILSSSMELRCKQKQSLQTECVFLCMMLIATFVAYVTGSVKRYTNAQAMIFQYKRCCSKTRNIFYSLKKNFLGGLGIYNSLPTLTPKLRNWTSF